MEKTKKNKKTLEITYPAPYVMTLANTASSRANKGNNQMSQSPKPRAPQQLQSWNNTNEVSKNFVIKNIKHSKALSDRNKLWKGIMANSCISCSGCPRNPKRSESAAPHLKYGVFPKRKNPNRQHLSKMNDNRPRLLWVVVNLAAGLLQCRAPLSLCACCLIIGRNQSLPIELYGRDTSNMSNMHRLARSTTATIKTRRREREGLEEPPIYVYKPQNTDSRILSPTEVMHIDIKPTRDLRASPMSCVSPVFNTLPSIPT